MFPAAEIESETTRPDAWGAVFALTLCVSTLIASEVLPISLLTPIAHSLHVTEGRVGEAISMSGIFAVITSLIIVSSIRNINRRTVLLALAAILIVSGALATAAPNFYSLMLARALLGVGIGGFWSMSTATILRLVATRNVPRALAFLNGGNALAVMISAPLGSFLGQYLGWRGAFSLVLPLSLITLACLFITLPSLPASSTQSLAGIFRVIRRPQVPEGMAAVGFLFLGQFALFTYIRPFLESVTRVGISTISAILLMIGLAGLLGTWVVGLLLRERLYSVLIAMPLLMAFAGVGLIFFGAIPSAALALLFLWGITATAAPVGWWTWLAKVLPDDTEAGGSLMVAIVQLAITVGAASGGLLLDLAGARATFLFSSMALCAAALLALRGRIIGRRYLT